MSQLRQSGVYLKYNRTRAPSPCVYTFTVETNQKVGKFPKKKKENSLNTKREQFETADSSKLGTAEDSCTQDHEKEQTYKITTANKEKTSCRKRKTPVDRDVNGQQHRHSNESYGTMHRKKS